MRVKDLAEIIASLPPDQNIEVAIENKQGVRSYGRDFLETTTDLKGTLEIIFKLLP